MAFIFLPRGQACAALAALALSLTVAAQPLPTAQARAQAQEREFEQAQQRFRQRDFAGAYGRFVALADRGHAEAARTAWAMHRWSGALFGTEWYASDPQQRAWTAVMCEAVRP